MKNITIILFIIFLFVTQVSASVTVDKNSVTFSLTASTVSDVKVVFKGLADSLGSDTISLIKNANNIWIKTIKVPAGFYYYLFLVDCAPFYDQGSPWGYFGCGIWVGGFNVKDSANTFYDQKTGPFGNININYYKSNFVGDGRKCFVYTPAEYDNNPDKNYPVLYLLHDLGEDESAWLYQGMVNNILDNAINSDNISPMLVVFDNINAYKRISGKLTLPNLIDLVISSELVPYIDNNYHTIDSAKYRAIAGCATGGKLAMDIALHHNKSFGSVGVFTITSDFDTSQVMIDSIKHSYFNLILFGTGLGDSTYTKTIGFHQSLMNNGVTHVWDTQNGSNNWLAWRKNLYAMIKGLFK